MWAGLLNWLTPTIVILRRREAPTGGSREDGASCEGERDHGALREGSVNHPRREEEGDPPDDAFGIAEG
jgi:hypothetical protein